MTEREQLAELIAEYILIRTRSPNDERPFCEGLADYLLAKVDELAWRHKMRGHVSMDKFHDDIEELKQKYTEDQT